MAVLQVQDLHQAEGFVAYTLIPPSSLKGSGCGLAATLKLRASFLLSAVLLVACGATGSVANSRPPVVQDDANLQCRIQVVLIQTPLSVTGKVVTLVKGGFLTIPDGTFTADDASVVGLPGGQTLGGNQPRPYSYDFAAKRWLPVPVDMVSPDGQSYLYESVSGGVGTLHIYSLRDQKDRVIKAPAGSSVTYWDATGIVVLAVPTGNGSMSFIRINPDSSVTQPTGEVTSRDHPAGATSSFGHDGQGHYIWRTGSPTAGPYTVFFDLGAGLQTVVYAGTVGDTNDFSPYGATPDGSRTWFGNRDTKWVWMWSPRAGLKRYPITRVAAGWDVKPAGTCR